MGKAAMNVLETNYFHEDNEHCNVNVPVYTTHIQDYGHTEAGLASLIASTNPRKMQVT